MSTLSPSPIVTREALRSVLEGVGGVALLRGVLDDSAGFAVLTLLSTLAAPQPDAAAVAVAYGKAFYELAGVAAVDPLPGLPDAWQAHLVARIVDDQNPWSAQAESAGAAGVAGGLRAQAQADLRLLRPLYTLDAATIVRLAGEAIGTTMPALREAWTPWRDLAPAVAEDSGNAERTALCRRLAEEEDWAALVGPLEGHWARHGAGVMGRYRALRWEGRAQGLHPIAHPDPVRLTQLIGYEREQALLRTNVERFLSGLPAHDALLYGAPGTGKSSTVKAIANAYAERGLRLIEVRKEDLGDLPAIATLVRGRAPRFLLFVDDLSFEEHETDYKPLKALLEGAAEARPANLLLYATSNRRNLVRESFSEREALSDDVHGGDTRGEKVALAARFGLRVTFAVPDQERYVTIATALALQRGLVLSSDELRARALAWERHHPGRSGRTARQFVDDLQAEISSQ